MNRWPTAGSRRVRLRRITCGDGEPTPLCELADVVQDDTKRASGSIGSGVWFVLLLPFSLVFMFGDLLAWPLAEHRHRSVPCWLLWNLLRLSIPIAILLLGVIFLAARVF